MNKLLPHVDDWRNKPYATSDDRTTVIVGAPYSPSPREVQVLEDGQVTVFVEREDHYQRRVRQRWPNSVKARQTSG